MDETEDRGPAVDVAELAAGDEVVMVVMATVDGSTSTVERLIDLANLPGLAGTWWSSRSPPAGLSGRCRAGDRRVADRTATARPQARSPRGPAQRRR
ncbi:MAG: hypothetical protein M3455_02910 [Actinomycetota bacterium]|nr:hypothetical protein [Actinomycetota bacterium]